MERGKLNMNEVKQSLRDLVRVYEITEEDASRFVTRFSQKYRIPGFYKEFLQVAQDEIRKIETERTAAGQNQTQAPSDDV